MARKRGGPRAKPTPFAGKYKATAFKGRGTRANPIKSTRIKISRGRAPRGR